MLKHSDLLNLINSLDVKNISESDKTNIVRAARQIGFATPNSSCKCKDKYSDLAIKLKLWARQHPNECHYQMAPGLVRVGPNGTNVYQLNLTDEDAEWILENDPEGAKYIKKIAEFEKPKEPKEEKSGESELFEEVPAEVKVEAPKKKRTGERKKKSVESKKKSVEA